MRINIFGGPGCGKSTAAAWLFSELKKLDYSVELVDEYIKILAYNKISIGPWEQIDVMAHQLAKEYAFLNAGVKNIVTDSPLAMGLAYCRKYNNPMTNAWRDIVVEFDRQYPSFNVFLMRGDKYFQDGRYENLDQAMETDRIIFQEIRDLGLEKNTLCVGYTKHDVLLENTLKWATR